MNWKQAPLLAAWLLTVVSYACAQWTVNKLSRAFEEQGRWLDSCQAQRADLLKQRDELLKQPTLDLPGDAPPGTPSHCTCLSRGGGRCILGIKGGRIVQRDGDSVACW